MCLIYMDRKWITILHVVVTVETRATSLVNHVDGVKEMVLRIT